ncbi:MAG: c-type cytochrome [Nitrospirota bacterium]|nr:c-type cytochrome [Nitrospirota bacterium]
MIPRGAPRSMGCADRVHAPTMRGFWIFGLLLCAVSWSAPLAGHAGELEAPKVHRIQIHPGQHGEAPAGLDPVAFPAGNPQTSEKVALGTRLFFDPRLSGDGTVACASCHNPALGWSNGLSLAFGVRGQTGIRSAPTILNAAYADTLFWDGRAGSLEEQATGPLVNPVEMGNTLSGVVDAISSIPAYGPFFESAFGDRKVTVERIVQAIAAFERTLVSGASPFDRYKYKGERSALTASQIRGMELFREKERANCAKCHRFDDFSADLTDFRFHNVGVGMDHPQPDIGRQAVTGNPEDRGAFRTPTLRNVAATAPYMHDGRFATLEQVVDFYIRGATPNPNLDINIQPFELTDAEKADLIAFLNALTGDLHPIAAPELPSDPPATAP